MIIFFKIFLRFPGELDKFQEQVKVGFQCKISKCCPVLPRSWLSPRCSLSGSMNQHFMITLYFLLKLLKNSTGFPLSFCLFPRPLSFYVPFFSPDLVIEEIISLPFFPFFSANFLTTKHHPEKVGRGDKRSQVQVALLQEMDNLSLSLGHLATTSVHPRKDARNGIVQIPSETVNVNVSFKVVLLCFGQDRDVLLLICY